MLEKIKRLHTDLKLTGNPRNALLEINPLFFKYFLAVFQDKEPNSPGFIDEQWQELIGLLAGQGVAALFYAKLIKLPAHLLPPEEIMEKLRHYFLHGAARAIKMEEQFKPFSEAFRRKDISFLVLKGFSLARTIYPSPAARPASDIDILVSRNDWDKAKKTLNALGYQNRREAFLHVKEIEVEDTFTSLKSGRSFGFDMHWGLHTFYGVTKPVTFEELFMRRGEFFSPDFSFSTPGEVDALLHLIVHQTMVHGADGIRLIWVYDIGLLAEKVFKFNQWEALLSLVNQAGMGPAFNHALDLVEAWMGRGPFPEAAFSEEQNRKWKKAVLRHKNLFYWFSVCWPRSLPLRRQIELLFAKFVITGGRKLKDTLKFRKKL